MIRVGVLRGGQGDAYEQSLAHGALVLRSLPKDIYRTVDIFIDRSGVWHIGGLPVSHSAVLQNVDVVYDGTGDSHGRMLEAMGVPHLGAHSIHTSLSNNRYLLRDRLEKAGIKTPQSIVIDWKFFDEKEVSEAVVSIFKKCAPPWRVQVFSRDIAKGSISCTTRESLHATLLKMAQLRIPVVVREEVFGTPAQILVIPGFRSTSEYTCIPTHSEKEHIRFSAEESSRMQEVAKSAYRAAGIPVYCTVQVVVTRSGRVYVTDVQACPKIHQENWIHRALSSVGSHIGDFLHHLISHTQGIFVHR